jgi:hypothetical protein
MELLSKVVTGAAPSAGRCNDPAGICWLFGIQHEQKQEER